MARRRRIEKIIRPAKRGLCRRGRTGAGHTVQSLQVRARKVVGDSDGQARQRRIGAKLSLNGGLGT